MSAGRFLLYALLLYFLYRFVVNFLWPVIKVSRQMKRQVNEFQQHAREQADTYQQKNTTANNNSAPPPKAKAGDYIDFEEVK